MTEPMILRSVTVAEVMHSNGNVSIDISTEGEPALWDQMGLLAAGAQAVRLDMAAVWADVDEG